MKLSHKQKVWGQTARVNRGPNFEVHRIEAKAGGYCSRHQHQSKANHFFVESGYLKVIVYRDGKEICAHLKRHEGLVIQAGIEHRFIALEDTIAFETYYSELDPEDIVRDDVGGEDWHKHLDESAAIP